MLARPNTVTKTFLSAGRALGVLAIGLLSAACGRYEPEPEYPQSVQYVPPTPPTAAELATQQQASGESRDVVIGADENEYADTDPSALTEFKPALEGHGAWVDDSTYGTVWVPAREEVGADFQPYVTAGHWTYSDDTDYVWVSDYSWGWAPFHYGRWVYLPGHGWSWIPGRRYAGAWVTWRTGPAGYGYVGWAPAPPSWYWSSGVAYGWSFGFYDYHHHYVYCPHTHVYHHHVSTYVARGPAAHAQHYGRTQDYVPARPAVAGQGGDRVVASPTVGGDRVVAKPVVSGGSGNGSGRSNGGRGPRPDELGLKNEAVVAPPASDQGWRRAQALAAPSTAIAAGAAAPSQLRPASPDMFPSSRAPASNAFVPGAGVASASPSSPVFRSSPSGAPPAPVFRSSPSSPSVASPTPSPPVFRSSPSPAFREPPVRTPSTSPSPSPPVFRSSPTPSPSPPVFRSSPSPSQSPPVFRSSPSPSPPVFRSSPSPRMPSASAPTFRSQPSVRPSAPSVRSTPSSPTFRSASPRRK